MKSFLNRLLRGKAREDRTWTERVYVEEPSTPVIRYVNFMLIQFFKAGSQTKVLHRNVELPPLTVESQTCEPARLDEIVKRLKEMCDLTDSKSSTPVEGTVSCTFEGTSFDVKCHFDDNAEACCWISVEKSDEMQSDSSAIGSHRLIRYDSTEYRSFMKQKARMPWRKRIRRSAIWGLICACLVLAALIVDCLILSQMRWPVLSMIARALLAGAFIFVLMLWGYVQEDIHR